MSSTKTPRPYETPWPWNEIPRVGESVHIGSHAYVTVTEVTKDAIILDNGRMFLR